MKVATPDSKVTIAMPVYNGGHYFRLALQSALAQTHENTEIVVVDDGSTDGGETEAIAKETGSPKIRYIRQDNTGVGGAVNRAVENATGDFFCWLSHDDLFLPEKIAEQIRFHGTLGKPEAILCSNYDLIDPDGKLLHKVRFDHRRIRGIPMLPLMNGLINGCTLFIPLPILREFGPFDSTLRYVQDYDMWNRILSKYDFFFQPKALVQYRLHPTQDTNKPGAVVEGDQIWRKLIDSRSEIERVQLYGSRRNFFRSMAAFLDQTPYKEAAQYAREMAARPLNDVLVSIVIPFFNEVELAFKAGVSALEQTHGNIEVLMIDDGSTESLEPLRELARLDLRLRIIQQPNAGPGAARNRGLDEARGDYIAFLDADDLFAPRKVEIQLEAMQNEGYVFSHTSYSVTFPERCSGVGRISSGRFGGSVYPAILKGCPIATPTVMIHRSLAAAGYRFPTSSRLSEDTLFWVEVTSRHDLLGIDEPLSIVEWSSTSAALCLQKSLDAVDFQLREFMAHDVHSRHKAEIASLKALRQEVAELAAEQTTGPLDGRLNETLIASIFPDHAPGGRSMAA